MVKELQTRIALKYDSYTNWTSTDVADKGGNLVLLPGEIGICEIPAVQDGVSNVAPTVLFKVGGAKYPDKTTDEQGNEIDHPKKGQLMAFKDLPWASAKAADVYGWAKAKTVELVDKKLLFKDAGETEIHSVDLSSFASATVVSDQGASIATINGQIEALQKALGMGDDGDDDASVTAQIVEIFEALNIINGGDTVEGSIAKALKDAKDYTDSEITKAKTAVEKTAQDYTDEQVVTLNAKDAELAQEDARLAGLITEETNARAALEAKIGTVGKDDTVTSLIAAAKKEGTEAKSAVDALTAEGGAVAVNTQAIADHDATIAANTENISKNTKAIADEVKARGEADTALDARLATVEGEINAFFANAERDEDTKQALDTLVEIQQYLSGEGEATSGLMASVNKNTTDIQGLDSRVTANASNITELQTLTGGHTTAIGNAQAAAEAAQAAADAAQAAADAAQADVDAIEVLLNGTEAEGDVAAVPGLIDDVATNAANISALDGRMTTAEGAIDALEVIASTGDNANAKLREAITALEGTVNTGDNNNQALRDELTRVAGLVDAENTGLAATKTIADEAKSTATANASRLAVIEADYLTSTDLLIFNCGSALEVNHTMADNNPSDAPDTSEE